MEILLDEDPCQTQTELANALNVTQQCIWKRLEIIGMIRKLGDCLQQGLTERDI